MPRVPTYDNQQVKIAALPGVKQNIQTTAADFGGAQAQSLRNAGQQIGQGADQLNAFLLKKADEDNSSAALAAYTEYQTKAAQWDADARTTRVGANAAGITSDGTREMGKFAQEIASKLPTTGARDRFMKYYQQSLTQDVTLWSRHEATQRSEYGKQVRTGAQGIAAETAARDPANQASLDNAVSIIEDMEREGLKGSPADVVNTAIMTKGSAARRIAVERLAQQNPLMAQQVFERNRDKMVEGDKADLEKMLEVPVLTAKATAIAGQVVSPSGALPGNVSQRIAAQAQAQGVDITTALTIAKLENAKGDPNAKNPNSSARGIYQFIDKTWKAEGGSDADRGDLDKQVELGIRHIKKNQDTLRTALGREPTPAEVYLAHQQGIGGAKALLTASGPQTALGVLTKVYGGDAARARDAIVNNGGRADMAAADFVKLWDGKYARKVGGSTLGMPLSDQIIAAKAIAGDDPKLQQAAVMAVTEKYKATKAAEGIAKDEAMERIYGHVLQTGTYAGASPADLSKLDNKTLLDLQTKARDVKTDWGFYDNFMSMSPAEKAAVPLQTLMTSLGQGELRGAIKERNEGRTGASKAPWMQERATIVKNYAAEAGIKSPGERSKPADVAQYNALSEYLNSRMASYREKNGREMPESEFRQEAARAVTRVVTDKGTFFNDSSRVFELNGKPIVTINALEDVPATVRADIESAIRARGKTVSEALVLSLSKSWLTGDSQGARLLLEGAK